MKVLLIEFIGTFFLVFVIAMTGDPGAVAAVLAAMIYMGGHVSGAHYNPAVTAGMCAAGHLSTCRAASYIVSQSVGAVCAVLVAAVLGGEFMKVVPSEKATLFPAFLAESLFTFALVLTIFHVAVSKHTRPNSYFGLAIALVVFVGAVTVGPVSGAAFNPAVGLAPQLVSIAMGGAFDVSHALLYTVAPIFGALVAAGVYELTEKR
jgi:aquaporin Z